MPNQKPSQVIEFVESLMEIENLSFDGFFANWPRKPKTDLKEILKNSSHFVVAKKDRRAVGFIYCLSDNMISAYIPLLEVLPEFQGQGIGKKLLQKILKKLANMYMVDVICDEDLNSFYQKQGFQKYNGCIIRNRDKL